MILTNKLQTVVLFGVVIDSEFAILTSELSLIAANIQKNDLKISCQNNENHYFVTLPDSLLHKDREVILENLQLRTITDDSDS